MRRRLRILTWRYRYVIATALIALAVVALVDRARPPAPGTPVHVAVRDLPAGVAITAQDLALAPMLVDPAALAPDPVGLAPVVDIPAGVPIAESFLLGPHLADHAPPGTVVAPVHVADPHVLSLLRVGDRVDLYSPVQQSAELVARGVVVLAVGQAPAQEGLLGFGAQDTSMFLGAIGANDANLFTGAAGVAPFRVVISTAHD